jgi:hypothetical protein
VVRELHSEYHCPKLFMKSRAERKVCEALRQGGGRLINYIVHKREKENYFSIVS